VSDVAVTSSTGVLLDGRYRLLEQIGRGSMGTVHRARDEFLGRDVAVKLISTPVGAAGDLRRGADEVKVLARLNHDSLVTLFDAGSDLLDSQGPRIFLVMELIEGPDLRERIAQGPLPAREVGQIGHDMARVDRMEAVNRYQILDTPPDGAFDRITALAARLFAVPIAIVSVVDYDRIWFKSHHGVEISQIDRDPGLRASAILQNEPWIIQDATADPRALSNPLVADGFGLQFYAGVPLRTRDGYNLGTICVLDHQPRTFSPQDIKTLEDLAAIVMNDLELRLESRRSA